MFVESDSEQKAQAKSDLLGRLNAWWKRVWWARGILGAFALVGVVDSVMSPVTPQLLRVTHAVATGWNGVLRWLVEKIEFIIPIDLHLTRNEINFAALILVILVPGSLAMIVRYGPPTFSRERVGMRAVQASTLAINTFYVVFNLGTLVTLALTESDLVDTIRVVRMPMELHRFSEVGLWQMFWLFYGTLIFAALQLLWSGGRTYLKAIVITLTFVATLEVFYFAPFIGSAIGDAAAWLEGLGLRIGGA